MNEETRELVVDTGPLSHLAKAGWLGILRSVAGNRTVVIPEAVEQELRQGIIHHGHLDLVVQAEWIGRASLSSDDELQAFANFSSLLVDGMRNVGEAAVLAYAQVHGATAIVDDGAARHAAKVAGVAFQGTLGLLCEAIPTGKLTIDMISDLADHLLESHYRLPFKAGEFMAWYKSNVLLES